MDFWIFTDLSFFLKYVAPYIPPGCASWSVRSQEDQFLVTEIDLLLNPLCRIFVRT